MGKKEISIDEYFEKSFNAAMVKVPETFREVPTAKARNIFRAGLISGMRRSTDNALNVIDSVFESGRRSK